MALQDQTLTEAILSAKAGRTVTPGEFVVVDVDLMYAHDGTAPLAMRVMEDHEVLHKVLSPEKAVLVIDHASPPPTVSAATAHRLMRDFARKFNVTLYDVGTGVCHQVIVEAGHVKPGMVVLGADSHTVTLGALSAFATGVGSTDIAVAFATGKAWLKVPEPVKVVLEGPPKPWVMGKDIALTLLGEVGTDGLTYKAAEFQGTALKHISMDSRMTISNMCVEAGAKVGIFPADETLIKWLRAQGINSGVSQALMNPGHNAPYSDELRIDVNRVEPMVAAPPNVDNVRVVNEVEGVEVDQVFIGSCTNGRYEDFAVAAKILKGRRVKAGVRCIAVPASRRVYKELLRSGIIDVLINAGCFVAHSTCGPCIGAHLGLLAPGETAISTSNRNFTGRMGHKDSKVYLASPATAAASAVKGMITDPREFLNS